MGFFKILWGWVTKAPLWVQLYLGMVLLPNILLNATLVYFIFLPWHHNSIQASITPMKEARDVQINNMLKVQEVQNKAIISQLKQFHQHQSIMYQALLSRQPTQ